MSTTRRKFLSQVSMWASLVVSYGVAAWYTARYLYPAKRPPRIRSLFVGRLDAIGDATIIQDLRGVPVQIVKDGSKLCALSTVCTHLGCRVRWEGEKFLCPCHNAAFDKNGNVVSGPPPRPLDRYDVEVVDGSVYLKVKEPA